MDVHLNPSTTTIDTTSQIKNGQYYYSLGNYHASRGNYTKAAELFQQSINLDASMEDAYINLANSYGMLKEYERSINVSAQLLKKNPNNIKALENLAVTYRLLGNNKKAEEYSSKANTIRNQ